MKPRWKFFAQGLMFLALVRLIEWMPSIMEGLGGSNKIVPLWQDYNNWFEPSELWLTNWFAISALIVYACLLIWQLFKPSVLGLVMVGAMQFQLHLVLYFFVTMADNWRLICLWYAIAGVFFNSYNQGHWVRYTLIGHLWIFYWVTAWFKLSYPDWQSGVSLSWIAWHPYWGASFPTMFSGSFFTYTTIALEILFPISWLFKSTRKWGVLVGLLFHTILMLFIPVVGFSLIMIWSVLMVLTEEEWSAIKKALHMQRLKIKFIK